MLYTYCKGIIYLYLYNVFRPWKLSSADSRLYQRLTSSDRFRRKKVFGQALPSSLTFGEPSFHHPPLHACYNHPRVPKKFSRYRPILRQVHWMTLKWPGTVKGYGTSYTHYKYPQVSNFALFCIMANRFRVTGHFETSAPNDPKITFKNKRSEVPHTHFTTNPLPSQIALRLVLGAGVFELHRPFWEKCTEWPQKEIAD